MIDVVAMEGGAVLTGVICAGSLGTACGAAIIAEAAALDNFSDDCAACDEKYYIPPPPCDEPPEEPPPEPEELIFHAWNGWSDGNLWGVSDPFTDNYSNSFNVMNMLDNALSNEFGNSWDGPPDVNDEIGGH